MYPDAVIFDFDGIIVDTEPIHFTSFQKILKPLALDYSWDEYVSKYMGYDDRDAFLEVFKTKGLQLEKETLNELIAQKSAVFEHIILNGVEPYPGVIDIITELYQQNIPLIICSGALRSDILPILDQLGINTYFSDIISADDVIRSKPDPACYLLAKQRLIQSHPNKLNTESYFCAIEDTPAGITAAQQAGIKVVAVTNSYSAEKLVSADKTIASLTMLTPSIWP